MLRRPPRSTRTDTLFPYTTLFRSVLWDAQAGGAMEIPRAHGVEDSELFLKSPVRLILEGGPPLRRRLARADCPLDFPITQEIKPEGYTDYTARPLPFSIRQINTLTLASIDRKSTRLNSRH